MLCAKCGKNPRRLVKGKPHVWCKVCATLYHSVWRRGGRWPHAPRHKVGSASPNWKGGSIGTQGYRVFGDGGKTKSEHRAVMEKHVGRSLKSREIVHHWDEDKLNNTIENLALLRHRSAHNRIHRFAKRHGLSVAMLQFDQTWLTA